MDIESLRNYCLAKKGVTEKFPFDEETLTFQVMEKIFLFVDINLPESIIVKCEPELALELREKHEEITPGYHMNKKHWNSVSLKGRLKKGQLLEMIDHSYQQVIKGLTKKKKEELQRLS